MHIQHPRADEPAVDGPPPATAFTIHELPGGLADGDDLGPPARPDTRASGRPEGGGAGHRPSGRAGESSGRADESSGPDGDELPARRPHAVLWGSLNRTADAVVGARSARRLVAAAVRRWAVTGAPRNPGLATA